jgi:hypothetical protein
VHRLPSTNTCIIPEDHHVRTICGHERKTDETVLLPFGPLNHIPYHQGEDRVDYSEVNIDYVDDKDQEVLENFWMTTKDKF